MFEDLEFCLLEERARIVREIGMVIESEYQGSFVAILESCNHDIPTLVRKIVQLFSGFRDEAIYNGE